MEKRRRVVVTCCREVLGRSLVGKCVCVCVGKCCRGFLKECFEGVLWRSVVVKCCGEVL